MGKLTTIITKNAEETKNLGEKLAHTVVGERSAFSHVVCLYGELGMGKTTFVQGMAKGLGITSRLLSPTFIIVRRHILSTIRQVFYHLDLYRIESEKEMEELGLQEIFENPHHIVVVEWAERLGSFLPSSRVDVRFCRGSSDQERRIEITYV